MLEYVKLNCKIYQNNIFANILQIKMVIIKYVIMEKNCLYYITLITYFKVIKINEILL